MSGTSIWTMLMVTTPWKRELVTFGTLVPANSTRCSKPNVDGDGVATWQEFGQQGRDPSSIAPSATRPRRHLRPSQPR